MKTWIRRLRIGALLCLLPVLFILVVCLPSYMSGEYEVERKYQARDQFRINAIGPGEIDAPYSKRFYNKAQPGDNMHFGFHHITLRRDGKLVVVEIPAETRMTAIWLLLALFPLTAFAPEERMPLKRGFLTLVTVAEIITLGTFLFGFFMPA
jgi:hypothetical protein